jgi:dihydrofolate synthase/folylpolyglutamate synthase
VDYRGAIDWLFGLQRFGIKLGLANIGTLLAELGSPERSVPAVIVGGTNGKGSTATFLARIARASGLRVGLYTSPHLQRFNERITVDDVEIPDDEVARETVRVREVVEAINADRLAERPESERMAITFFEFATVLAIRHFVARRCDLGVFEVGMGGRLDATNVLPALASVVTHVALEHRQYLGDTVPEIAFEKAGILKPGRPAVTAERRPEALAVLRSVAAERGTALHEIDRDFAAESAGEGRFDYRGIGGPLAGVRVGLPGRHQTENAACALAAWELLAPLLGSAADERAMRAGIAAPGFAGRLSAVRDDPPVLLDVAHNPDAMEVLVRHLEEEIARTGRRPVVLIGMMRDKDAKGTLALLAKVAADVIVTRARIADAVPAEDLAGIAWSVGLSPTTAPTVADGMAILAQRLSAPDVLGLVTGSFYVVGEAMDYLDLHPEWPGGTR